nr:DegT/DnrJ/EryC1/StrS family aminotransferase [Agrobacterium pusense]
MEKMIPVYRPRLAGNEKLYVNECLDSTWISSRGQFIERFEAAFEDYTGAAHAISVSNGTVAIHLALVALGIGPGDEVIVPSLTYVASVNCILQSGALPVYVDSCAATWQIDVNDIESKITPRTKAIMAVHLYGLPCDMETLVKICRKHGLLLIEDCAEAFGSHYREQHVGTFGDAATFSFFGNKTITTGEGGMVVIKDREIAARSRRLKSQGVSPTREYWHDMLAFNYRMTNICAAIGLAQLEQADEIIRCKRDVADRYREALRDLPLDFHDEVPGTVHSFWMCSVAVRNAADREPMREHMANLGIETRPVFYPSHFLPHLRQELSLPNAEDISSRGLNLPSFPDLTRAQIEAVTDSMRTYFDRL